MPAFKLIGHNYQYPDLVAKVTGRAKYTEDFRAEGMLFCRLLGSPMPHARVRGIDTADALKVPGVRAIITAADLPEIAPIPSPLPPAAAVPQAAPNSRGQAAIAVDEHGQPIQAGTARPSGPAIRPEAALTLEPLYEGEPIAAVAAVDEATAAAAIERIVLDLEPLPFVVDPLESLRPGGPNARTDGNVLVAGNHVAEVKWTQADFDAAPHGQLPAGRVPEDFWSFGDVDAGFRDAALVVDESFVVPTTSHICLEPRSAMAYWQNGKLFMHCPSQSMMNAVPSIARMCGVDPSQLVFINPYTGGGFGSKNPASVFVAIPALLAKKTGQPVLMRISRDDEMNIGRARPGMVGRAKVGFAKDGRITALDLFIVSDAGPYGRGDHMSGARLASVLYQPPAMRFRGVGVLTNTAPRGSQRGPGTQFVPTLELVLTKAARKLGIDEVAIHRVNAPSGKAHVGPPQADGSRRYITSAFVKEALDKGAEVFDWKTRKQRSGTRQGTKVRGAGVCVGAYSAGSMGYDGLMVLEPDGMLHLQSGVGALGTNSVFDTSRAAAEALDVPWEKVILTRGDSSKNLPWSCGQGGSQTTHAHTRANWAAALDLKRKLQEIAAHDLGGKPEDYEVANERVVHRGGGRSLSFGDAARRAIALGGRYDGHDLPDDIHPLTRQSASALAGRGVMGVAKDNFGRDGDTMSFTAGFAEVEVDVETGALQILDYAAVVDSGTIVHPRNCQGQTFGGSMLGMSHAVWMKWVYDRHYGTALARRFYHSKPPSILDAPAFQWDAVDLPDPETPVGARGVGEPPVCAAYGAVINALIAAVGDEAFRRSPVTADIILESLEAGGRWMHEPLISHV